MTNMPESQLAMQMHKMEEQAWRFEQRFDAEMVKIAALSDEDFFAELSLLLHDCSELLEQIMTHMAERRLCDERPWGF